MFVCLILRQSKKVYDARWHLHQYLYEIYESSDPLGIITTSSQLSGSQVSYSDFKRFPGHGYSLLWSSRVGLRPEVQPLIFWEKRYPFRKPSIEQWYPFQTYTKFRTLHPF